MIEYIAAAVAAYVCWTLVCLEINYRRAKSIGFPLIRVPIDPLNVPFQVIEPHLFKLFDLLPSSLLPEFVPYLRRGWFFLDKADSHLRYGPIFAVVTPRSLHIQVADSEAIHDIFSRRLDFIRPSDNYTLLEVYGPCISTADLTNWPRHRKVLAAPFNESIMKFVWKESLDQAKQMLATWTTSTATKDGIFSVAKDTRTLSLNVLAATGFGRSFSFKSASEGTSETDTASSYRDALSTVLDNAILLMLIPRRYLSFPFLPKSLQRIGTAAEEFQHHMERMIEEENAAFKAGKHGAGGLMTSLIKASNIHDTKGDGPSQPQGLSVEEIYGNIFVINFAGHDTTANTLAFSMYLLATAPKVQDWVTEEVRRVISDDGDWEYGRLFPQLLRCRAVLLETLRLFPPILSLPKHTNSQPQRLQVGDRTYIIPAKTSTSPSLIGVQTHPQYWPEPLEWKPERWITKDSSNAEALITPPRDTYFPWSDGPQNCPGVKFSQVEFVAVLALLTREHRMTIVKEEGESEEKARKRVQGVLNECDMQLLLRMQDADKAKLRLSNQLVPLTIIKGAGHEFIPLPQGENATVADFHTIRTKTTPTPSHLTSGFYKITAGPARPAAYDFEETKYVLSGQIDVLDEATGITHHLVSGDFAFFHVGSKVQFSTQSNGLAFYAVTRPVKAAHPGLVGREEGGKGATKL